MRAVSSIVGAVVVTLALVACLESGDAGSGDAGSGGSSVIEAAPDTTGARQPDAAPAPTGESTAPATTTVAPPTTVAPLVGLAYEAVAGADFPMILTPDEIGGRDLVGLRGGEVRDLATGDVLLDLDVPTDGERGLLGMDVGPGGDLFVHATAPDGATIVLRFPRSGGGFDAESAVELLRVPQPASNHNGGMLQFGPDGRLYVGLGDGGGANDQFGQAQDFDTLLGGLVAIHPATGEAELVAGGLRNPFRFWIDPETSLVAIGDVGQSDWEEVSVARLDGTFHNFGWPVTEGFACFGASDCDRGGLVEPIVAIAHGDAGTCSITGGVVYRGTAIPELTGEFLFSDFCGGYLRSVPVEGPAEVTDWTADVGVPGQVVSFGEGLDGEVYVLTTSEILRLVPRR